MIPSRVQVALGLAVLCVASAAVPAQNGQPPRRPGAAPGGGQGAQEFVDRLMANDANKDGKLSRDELPGQFGERLLAQGDANGDGFLDRAELTAMGGRWGGERGGGQGGFGPGGASFEAGMRQAGRGLRALKESALDSGSAAADLDQIQAVQAGLTAAKGRVATVPMSPAAREKFKNNQAAYVKAFRLQIIDALAESLILESAVLAGDTAAARASLAKLIKIQEDGHGLFQDEHEEEEEEHDDDDDAAENRGGGGVRPR